MKNDRIIRDDERVERIRQSLAKHGFSAFVCALPSNVLLLTGYFPVVGTAIAVFHKSGKILLVAPKDEKHLAEDGWADEILTFEFGSLTKIESIGEAVSDSLKTVFENLVLKNGIIGYESGAWSQPASYAAMNFYGALMPEILKRVCSSSVELKPADFILKKLRSVKTSGEIERIQTSCRIAAKAFENGAKNLKAGMNESEVAAIFRSPLVTDGIGFENVKRADGFAWCMSGANSAKASAAYAMSSAKKIEKNEFILVHCNSYADGFWTDITRTFCLGEIGERKRKIYEAIFAARRAALEKIRPGVLASEVDKAAREELKSRGYGKEFRHQTGHGVGFAAIDHNAAPRIHPASDEILQTGMVFNVEPAIYIENFGGVRHCDVVAITENGAEVLTDFQTKIEDLLLE